VVDDTTATTTVGVGGRVENPKSLGPGRRERESEGAAAAVLPDDVAAAAAAAAASGREQRRTSERSRDQTDCGRKRHGGTGPVLADRESECEVDADKEGGYGPRRQR